MGISAIVIGIRRTEASATAMAAGISPMPDDNAPVRTTMDGNAQMKPVINSVSASDSPVSRASPAKPTKAAVRINAGIEMAARAPSRNHSRSLFGGSSGAFVCAVPLGTVI